MGLKSRMKGKRGEREAASYLRALGFYDARRTAQCRGTALSGDVECPETLPHLMIEVKYGYPRTAFDLGTSLWISACDMAAETCGNKFWVILWKPKGCREWRMTFAALGTQATIAGDTAIRHALLKRRLG